MKSDKAVVSKSGNRVPVSVLYGAASAAAILGALLLNRSSRANRFQRGPSGFGWASGGFVLGAGAMLLALLELPREPESGAAPEKPSMASRILSRIPLRVKLATVAGAVKGGGGEALREAGKKIARSRASSRM